MYDVKAARIAEAWQTIARSALRRALDEEIGRAPARGSRSSPDPRRRALAKQHDIRVLALRHLRHVLDAQGARR